MSLPLKDGRTLDECDFLGPCEHITGNKDWTHGCVVLGSVNDDRIPCCFDGMAVTKVWVTCECGWRCRYFAYQVPVEGKDANRTCDKCGHVIVGRAYRDRFEAAGEKEA